MFSRETPPRSRGRHASSVPCTARPTRKKPGRDADPQARRWLGKKSLAAPVLGCTSTEPDDRLFDFSTVRLFNYSTLPDARKPLEVEPTIGYKLWFRPRESMN